MTSGWEVMMRLDCLRCSRYTHRMRPIEEWTETDLLQLVADEVQESLQLDYKRSDALGKSDPAKNELAKDVSAFANSAGGLIVYGIEEEGHVPKRIDGGSDVSTISREWIEQVIHSRIQPRVSGVVIKPIMLSSGGQAFVLDIPQATVFAPHQAFDKKYYRRFNFASVPMEDYEIRDALRRATTGKPVAYFSWRSTPRELTGREFGTLTVRMTNLSSEPVHHALLQVFVDERLTKDQIEGIDGLVKRAMTIELDGVRVENIAIIQRNIMPSNHMPLFSEEEWHMHDIILELPANGEFALGYRVSCPGYPSFQELVRDGS